MIRVEQLHKTFQLDKGGVRAVQGVSFTVNEGEFFTLLGPSGSGKSTILRCLAGLEHPEQGEIFIGSQRVFSSQKKHTVPPEERPIGMVFQSYAIWPHMNVFENVAFPLKRGTKHGQKRLSEGQIAEAVAEALKKVNLAGMEERPATQLSGGQQQRVALARALAHKPAVLLLDEPLSNLDAKLREEMREELRELTKSLNITSVYVTHDQVEALALSDRIAVLMEGALVAEGLPFELYLHPRNKRVADFLGAANVLEGTILKVEANGDGVMQTAVGTLHFSSDSPAAAWSAQGKVAALVRPEAIICAAEKPGPVENIFLGTIQRVTFQGSVFNILLRVNDATLRVFCDVYNSTLLPSAGQKVYVCIPREHVNVVGAS